MPHLRLSILYLNTVSIICIALLGCANDNIEWIPDTPLANYVKIHNERTEYTQHPNSLKILAIGNSFTNNSIEYLPYILKSYNLNNITLGKICHGGASLQNHERFWRKEAHVYQFQLKTPQEIGWNINIPNATIREAVQYTDWDIIVLQQASALSGLYKDYQPYLNRLIEHILSAVTNPDVVFVWHMTWPYSTKCKTSAFSAYKKTPAIMYNSICNATKNMMKETGIKYLIPSGECIYALRNSIINKDTTDFTEDGIHIDHPIGQYALAYTWFLSIIQPIYNQNLDSTTIHLPQNTSLQLNMEEEELMKTIIENSVNHSLIYK